jgi:hypothetical protein
MHNMQCMHPFRRTDRSSSTGARSDLVAPDPASRVDAETAVEVTPEPRQGIAPRSLVDGGVLGQGRRSWVGSRRGRMRIDRVDAATQGCLPLAGDSTPFQAGAWPGRLSRIRVSVELGLARGLRPDGRACAVAQPPARAALGTVRTPSAEATLASPLPTARRTPARGNTCHRPAGRREGPVPGPPRLPASCSCARPGRTGRRSAREGEEGLAPALQVVLRDPHVRRVDIRSRLLMLPKIVDPPHASRRTGKPARQSRSRPTWTPLLNLALWPASILSPSGAERW